MLYMLRQVCFGEHDKDGQVDMDDNAHHDSSRPQNQTPDESDDSRHRYAHGHHDGSVVHHETLLRVQDAARIRDSHAGRTWLHGTDSQACLLKVLPVEQHSNPWYRQDRVRGYRKDADTDTCPDLS